MELTKVYAHHLLTYRTCILYKSLSLGLNFCSARTVRLVLCCVVLFGNILLGSSHNTPRLF